LLVSVYYLLLGCEINYKVLDHIFGLGDKSSVGLSFKELLTIPTISFFVLLYILSYLWGCWASNRKQDSIKKHIEKETPLFNLRDISLFGLWSAIIYSNESSVEINIDILTDGDLLYSGELYHFELNESGMSTITLKDTKRFLVGLSEVKGKNEKKYSIPGEFTHFFVSKVKNINLKSIIESEGKTVFWGENLGYQVFDEKKFQADLKKIMSESFKNAVNQSNKAKSENKKANNGSRKNTPPKIS
jgi:hypothetical protein